MTRFSVLIALTLAISATAFTPTSRKHVNVVRMTAHDESQDRRSFGATILSGIVGASFVPSAEAKPGEGAKFSLFGLLGNADSYSEGGAYNSDQSKPAYSAYGPFSPVTDDSLANVNTAADKKVFLEVIVESEKRLKNRDVTTPSSARDPTSSGKGAGYTKPIATSIERKEWGEVITQLDRYLYNLRRAMNKLSTTPESKAAAVTFYKAIETLNGACTTKDQAAASAAYSDSLYAFDAWKVTAGI